MIISRTPFRISFFGGGTDFPLWYREHGGEVLGATIDKYCYLTCRWLPPFFDHRIRIVYSKIENCQTIDEIKHPAVREVIRYRRIDRGIEIHHDGDLPARSGIGSSSSFTVGLLNALAMLENETLSRHQLATQSIVIEQELLKETVGSQDQVLAAYGGFNHILFSPSGHIEVSPVTASPQFIHDLQDHLMLFYTGINRSSSEIAKSYHDGLPAKESGLGMMRALVKEAAAIVRSEQDLKSFGSLLHEAWKIKSGWSSAVANSEVWAIYNAARDAGALGGKLTGAGGGGFLLLFVPPMFQARVREKLSPLIEVPIRFDQSGSQIIFSDKEKEYRQEEALRKYPPLSLSE